MEIKKCPICDQNPKMKSCFFEEYGEYFLNFKCCNFETKYHKNIFDAVKDWNNIVDKENIKESFEDLDFTNVDSITNLPKSSKQLADEHWGYIEALLKAHEEEYNIKQIEFHYKSAFIHGYKHAMEEK